MTYKNTSENALKGYTLSVSYTGADAPCCVCARFVDAEGNVDGMQTWDSLALFESYAERVGFLRVA